MAYVPLNNIWLSATGSPLTAGTPADIMGPLLLPFSGRFVSPDIYFDVAAGTGFGSNGAAGTFALFTQPGGLGFNVWATTLQPALSTSSGFASNAGLNAAQATAQATGLWLRQTAAATITGNMGINIRVIMLP